MSAHGEPHEEAHADHDDHSDHGHDVVPPPEEPPTPLWLTLVGVGLFLAGGILFVATRADGKTTAELAASGASAEPAAAPAADPAPTAGQPANAVRPGAPPNPQGMPAQPPGAPGAPQIDVQRLPNQPPAGGPPGGSKRPGHEGHDHE